MTTSLRKQVLASCRHLLSEINRDPASDEYGCFDRRFWAWKIVDFPEATFQRNVYSLSWYLDQSEAKNHRKRILNSIRAGVLFTMKIQHADGSFDQAYPYEHSFGATAFLLPDLIDSYLKIKELYTESDQQSIDKGLHQATNFVLKNREQHGFISNHLAGAAYGLLRAGMLFKEERFIEKAHQITGIVISKQSDEGWYEEYGGADPGYQSLCMYYLARFYQLTPNPHLQKSLEKSLEFLEHFVHPDGSFGGEYGSRRTEIYYPGGIALLTREFPKARSIHTFMLKSIEDLRTVTLQDVDLGNTAPLLINSILALDVQSLPKEDVFLPAFQKDFQKFFPQAGIAIVSTPAFYSVIGASNGGVLKIFDKSKKKIILDDCGVLGETASGKKISSQITNRKNQMRISNDAIDLESSLYLIGIPALRPFNFFLLRLMNLSLMRVRIINEWMKKNLVKMLMKNYRELPFKLIRNIQFERTRITITDEIIKKGPQKLRALFTGQKFSAIHMASSRYFCSAHVDKGTPLSLNIEEINDTGQTLVKRRICFPGDRRKNRS